MTELSLNDVNLSRAVEFFKQGQLDDAQTCLLSVLQAAPANPDALYFMSMIDFRAGRTAVAENRACELVYVMPEDGKALNLLGNIQMNLGKFDEANQTYARGMKSDPTNSTIWVNAAICFLGQGKPERSLELSREAASLEPDSSNAHNVMGSAYLAINQLADAKKCFEMALSVSPGDIDAKFNLGKVQLDMGSRDAAIEIFDQILMENPLHLQALTRKGDALSSARQFQDAESCYRKALETEPSFLIAYIGYGKLLLSVAKPNEALERLKKALDIDPTCIEALMLVGKAFQMLDQTDGAAAAFRDVLSIDPSNYDAEFMLASVEGTGAPAKPDGSYVRRLFDDFA
ncbi:MAG TPA: tetratricopeptide repeat protein, partial [Chromatiales bacterium]|nr:tetratricopeptide repeat protein [Chromatiales bacterium]